VNRTLGHMAAACMKFLVLALGFQVMLQSQIPVDLLDIESNVAILSRSPPDRYVVAVD
jgi:hypothetical protein